MRAAGDPELKMYGILGYPLGHTVSPAIQNQAFDYYGLKSIYFAFERPPVRFRLLMRNLKTLLLDGFNVTVPYKEAVIPYLNRLDPKAKIIGAINTVKKEGKRWVGYNTDVDGFLAGLRAAKFSVRDKSAVVLGAGGASRAVLFGLAREKVSCVTVLNRTPRKAQNLVNKFRKIFSRVEWKSAGLNKNDLALALQNADVLVNATKIGLKKNDPLLIRKGLFPKRKIFVYDLIYRPRWTRL